MIRRRSFATVFAVLVLSTAGAVHFGHATEAEGRFAMQPADGGILRLDTQTGAMSFCRSSDGSWACERIEDDSADVAKQLREVERENVRLRNEIKELRSTPLRSNRSEAIIPDEKDVDRAFSFLDRVLKRFKGMVEDLRSEGSNGTPL